MLLKSFLFNSCSKGFLALGSLPIKLNRVVDYVIGHRCVFLFFVDFFFAAIFFLVKCFLYHSLPFLLDFFLPYCCSNSSTLFINVFTPFVCDPNKVGIDGIGTDVNGTLFPGILCRMRQSLIKFFFLSSLFCSGSSHSSFYQM